MKFSVITVCLNPGEKLALTLGSILKQSYPDVEVILKDGGSTDGSVEKWRRDNASCPHAEKVRIFTEKDRGIYDAMNQAVSHVTGDFVLFLNCGDTFADEKVLERTAEALEEEKRAGADLDHLVLYGDTCGEKRDVVIASAPHITGFTCYRNIPCHQSCFYSAALCREKPYDLQYKIRADYDHFLWCYYEAKAKMRHMDFPVAVYEGGGFSENRKNRELDKTEHRRITGNYMGKGELFCYRLIMLATLAPLRSAMAESRMFSGVYHLLKERIYKRRIWCLAAMLCFCLEMFFLVGPPGLLEEDEVNYLTGEGAWDMEREENFFSCCQEFRPEYASLQSIGIVLEDGEWSGGTATVAVSDSMDNILFETDIPYEQMNAGYTDIEMNILFPSLRQSYYLSVRLGPNAAGRVPVLRACSTEFYMPENIMLRQKDDLPGEQILTRYAYTDAISKDKIAKAFFLCVLTAAGMAFGIPENRKIRKTIGIGLLLLGPCVLGRQLELLIYYTSYFMLPFSMKWNIGLMYLLECILLLCSCSVRFSVCVTNLILVILYSVNYYMFAFRGSYLRLNDLSAVGTAAKVIGNYDLRPNSQLAMAWCIFLAFFVYGAKVGAPRIRGNRKKRILMRLTAFGLGIIITAVSGRRLLYTDLLTDRGFMNIRGFEQYLNYQFDGYLVASFLDIQNSRIEKPQDYSVEKVEKWLAETKETGNDLQEDKEIPHIILIMNEAFSDLRVLGNLELSRENMTYFNSLKENTVRGYVNASVLGGGTANSEFEVFTGSSMGFLPQSYYAYNQCMIKEMPSMISDLKDLGYTAWSIHPAPASNWNRGRVYQYLGFDHSLWTEDFPAAETLHGGVSDLETYKKVEELFEGRKENEKLFIFDLTIQNHGGYSESDVERSVEALNVSSEEANIYLSLVKESDDAFRQLVNYFEAVEEPVIICMYGDHQPKLDDSFYEAVYAQTENLEERDKILNQYKVPFVIWANYDIEEREEMDIGMSYLGVLLMETAGLPTSPFFSFLQGYMEEYPIITVNGYKDKNGTFYNWSGEGNELPEYRMIQYNHIFDNDMVEWGF